MSFSDMLAQAEGTFDRTFGEAFTLTPISRSDPNGPGGVDPTRPVVPFVGIPSELHARAGAENGPSQFDSPRGAHASVRWQVSVTEASLPYRPRRGDRVTKDATGEAFVVAEVRPEGDRRLALDLNALSRP